jgi:cbb3-type cytochrome oxidase cytochrome c subunit
LLLAVCVVRAADANTDPGLRITFVSDVTKASDITTAPNVWLYVESGAPPTPFLPGGRFTATWEGAIRAELRGSYLFQAELNGKLTVEINGKVALEAAGEGGASPLSKAVPLNKGTNAFKAIFVSPGQADAFVRLSWAEKGPFTAPVPLAAFSHAVDDGLQKATQLRFGRELFLDHRCIKCHADPELLGAGMPELMMDAPSLDGIGARRHYDWMARWILDPKSIRPSALMPKLLAGPQAKEDAEAIASYLASLQTGGVDPVETPYRSIQSVPKGDGEPSPASGRKPLYERLHCGDCHNPPNAQNPDPKKLSQQRVGEKFPPGKLAQFLRAPEASYAWIRMPNFHLSQKEAEELEAWLFAAAPKVPRTVAPTDPSVVAKGKRLVQTMGCLNCHVLKLDNQYAAPPLAALAADKWSQGCLAEKRAANARAPDFGFAPGEREALTALGRSGRAALARHVPAEFAERQTRALNCQACHGQIDLVPPLELLGGKLKPEWAAKFMAGDFPHKMRFDFHPNGEPWLEARMPAYKSRAAFLATGLAEQQGYPPKSTAESPVNTDLAELGRKLVGKDGGFSCVSCHAVGPLPALEVFESEGIDLALSADRLQPDYYRRWFRAPTSIDPQTKMPVYFDDGKSPLTEILDGDGEKQITAVWEYLKLRHRMPAPRTEVQ